LFRLGVSPSTGSPWRRSVCSRFRSLFFFPSLSFSPSFFGFLSLSFTSWLIAIVGRWVPPRSLGACKNSSPFYHALLSSPGLGGGWGVFCLYGYVFFFRSSLVSAVECDSFLHFFLLFLFFFLLPLEPFSRHPNFYPFFSWFFSYSLFVEPLLGSPPLSVFDAFFLSVIAEYLSRDDLAVPPPPFLFHARLSIFPRTEGPVGSLL